MPKEPHVWFLVREDWQIHGRDEEFFAVLALVRSTQSPTQSRIYLSELGTINGINIVKLVEVVRVGRKPNASSDPLVHMAHAKPNTCPYSIPSFCGFRPVKKLLVALSAVGFLERILASTS